MKNTQSIQMLQFRQTSRICKSWWQFARVSISTIHRSFPPIEFRKRNLFSNWFNTWLQKKTSSKRKAINLSSKPSITCPKVSLKKLCKLLKTTKRSFQLQNITELQFYSNFGKDWKVTTKMKETLKIFLTSSRLICLKSWLLSKNRTREQERKLLECFNNFSSYWMKWVWSKTLSKLFAPDSQATEHKSSLLPSTDSVKS